MATTVQIRSGDSASLASPALVPLLLGCASDATDNQVYTFDPGADVSGEIGGGIGADAVLAMLRITKRRVRFCAVAPTWSAAPSVMHVGSGPAITLALATDSPGCFDDQNIVITVKVGGDGGDGASMDVAYDGATIIETLPIPAEIPAVLTGTVNLLTFTYPYTGLNTKHLDFTDPSSAVITFGTGYATPQAIADAFNTAAAAVPTAGSETSSAGSFPVALAHGDTFLGKVDQQGSATTLTISAVAASKTGSGATYAAVTAGHQTVIDLDGTEFTVVFTGSEATQAAFHATINAVIAGFGLATNSAAQTKISTTHKGSSATGAIVSADSDVLASLGMTVAAFTAGTGNVANVAAVTAAEFAALLTSTFTGGTAGSTGTAIGADRVTWATNTAGASPKGVQFTSGTGVAKIAGFDNAEHNGTTAANLAVRARISQDSAGASYFQLYSVDAGASVTITIDDGASDADTILGFSSGADNLTADGAPATFSPPWTGLTFTFPAGTDYVAGDTYTATCAGPRATIGALADAAAAAKDEYVNSPFGFIAVAQPSDTAANCAALAAALTTLTEEWAADAQAPIFVDAVVGAPFFATSTVLATNTANIQTADAALLLAFQSAATNFNNVATCDCYLPGATTLRFGFYRRTAALAWAIKHATAPKLAADVAEGLIAEVSLLAPKPPSVPAIRARNDATATTKLGGGQGPGFSALKATQAGLAAVKFAPGATRAGPTSRLRYVGPVTVALEIARLVFPFIEAWEGQTPPANPVTRQLSDGEKQQRQADVYTLLQPTLLPVGQPPNVTPLDGNKGCLVQVLNPATGVFLDNGQVIVRISFIPLGEIETVFVDIVATGAIVTAA